MNAAVVELDSLANAIGAGTQDHDALLVSVGDLGFGGIVGLVVIRSLAGEFGSAGVYRFERRDDTELFAFCANGKLVRTAKMSDLDIGDAVRLRYAHGIGIKRIEWDLGKRGLDGDHVVHPAHEEAIDFGNSADLVNSPACAKSIGKIVDAISRGTGKQRLEVFLGKLLTLTVAAETTTTVLKGTHSLAKRFFERATDGHDFADGLHASGERVVGVLELLECKARNLDDAVVDGRLEAGRGCLGDVIDDLVKGVAHSKASCRFGNREAGCLGSQGRGTRNTRVHLDDYHAAVLGVDGELNVRTASLNADLFENGQRCHAHALVFNVGKRLSGRNGDGVAGVNAHGIEVLDRANDDAVAGLIAHDLHLELFPALDALFDEDLASRG